MSKPDSLGNISRIASGNYFENIVDKHKLSGLSAIRILIIDNDIHISGMVRSILNRLNFRTIHLTRKAEEAINLIEEHDIDLIISEWPMALPNGQEIVRAIRTQDSLRAQTLPILLLTSRGDVRTIYKARDAGITEFLVKPFSVEGLCKRLINIIENPRHFVISPVYIGPDRRRKKNGKNPGTSRRMSDEEKQENSIRKGKTTVIKTPQGEVHVTDPDHSLRQRIGLSTNAHELLDEHVIQNAQEVIQENLGEVHEWLGVDLVWLNHNFDLMRKGTTFTIPRDHMVEILLSIKAKAGMFNFNIAAEAASSFSEYLEAITDYQKPHDLVIKKHVDLLFVMFKKYMEGRESELSKDLIIILKQLREHIPPA